MVFALDAPCRDLPPREAASGQQNDPLSRLASPGMHRVLELVRLYGPRERYAILLTGETGTGKTTLARQLHTLSPRAQGPFQHFDAGAEPPELAASSLFGHVRGSFTGASDVRKGHLIGASGGTLFLDEIGKAPLGIQRMLLRFLDEGRFTPVGSDRSVASNARVIAATNTPLEQLVERGAFLPDLAGRLEMLTIALPPLRERAGDIPLLARGIVARHAPEWGYGVPPKIAAELMNALVRLEWPRNHRQLESVLVRILAEANGARILTLESARHHLPHCTQARVSGAEKRCVKQRLVDIIDSLEPGTNATVRSIAERVPCTTVTIYRYFRSFPELRARFNQRTGRAFGVPELPRATIPRDVADRSVTCHSLLGDREVEVPHRKE